MINQLGCRKCSGIREVEREQHQTWRQLLILSSLYRMIGEPTKGRLRNCSSRSSTKAKPSKQTVDEWKSSDPLRSILPRRICGRWPACCVTNTISSSVMRSPIPRNMVVPLDSATWLTSLCGCKRHTSCCSGGKCRGIRLSCTSETRHEQYFRVTEAFGANSEMRRTFVKILLRNGSIWRQQ